MCSREALYADHSFPSAANAWKAAEARSFTFKKPPSKSSSWLFDTYLRVGRESQPSQFPIISSANKITFTRATCFRNASRAGCTVRWQAFCCSLNSRKRLRDSRGQCLPSGPCVSPPLSSIVFGAAWEDQSPFRTVAPSFKAAPAVAWASSKEDGFSLITAFSLAL